MAVISERRSLVKRMISEESGLRIGAEILGVLMKNKSFETLYLLLEILPPQFCICSFKLDYSHYIRHY